MHSLFGIIFFMLTLPAFSGQLNLAVIQFPGKKTAAELEGALCGASLAELTNSNRTMTKESYLKGGYVIFFQSFTSAAHFRSSTRLSDSKADVDGSLANGRIHVSIFLTDGVAAGLRSFSRRAFQGSSELKPGQPRVISLRQITEKTRQMSRGNSQLKETEYCTAIIAQITE